MRYVFVDDSIPYDGYTAMRRPLGGPERAVTGLATALQLRGHDVRVINRTPYAHMADGAYYAPFGDAMQPKAADVLIAVRKPLLLGTLRAAKHRVLWVSGATDYLSASANQSLWKSFLPSLLFVSRVQAQTYKGALKALTLQPGVRNTFFELPSTVSPSEAMSGMFPGADPVQAQLEAASLVPAVEYAPAEASPPPPHAVVTTHPAHGLDWLLDAWTKLVHPQMPAARLSVYSAVLNKGLKGEAIPPEVAPVLEAVKAAASANVVVVEPRSDDGMAEVYRSSRVHLYPGHVQDYACWTLADSQAAGLPAVARALGGIEERVANGQTGYIVPDAAAFANVTLQILANDAVWRNLSVAAAEPTRRRTWAAAAEEFDTFLATIPDLAAAQ